MGSDDGGTRGVKCGERGIVGDQGGVRKVKGSQWEGGGGVKVVVDLTPRWHGYVRIIPAVTSHTTRHFLTRPKLAPPPPPTHTFPLATYPAQTTTHYVLYDLALYPLNTPLQRKTLNVGICVLLTCMS